MSEFAFFRFMSGNMLTVEEQQQKNEEDNERQRKEEDISTQ
jgi:hypothetical protein